MPEIEHHDLVLFADQKVNLKKDEVDDQRAQVNRLRDRIEAKIAVTPGYGLVKSLHAGSVAKGTALSSVNDRDLAVTSVPNRRRTMSLASCTGCATESSRRIQLCRPTRSSPTPTASLSPSPEAA